MKKLLIIQQDDGYFLYETLRVLENNLSILKNFELTILVNNDALNCVSRDSLPIIHGLITDETLVLGKHFDISANLSLNEKSWEFHTTVSTDKRIGAYIKDGQTFVDDLWSAYLMTLKAKAPFLTFHLQDIYRNILGIKSVRHSNRSPSPIRQIIFGASALHLFSAYEQEALINGLAQSHPSVPLKDISEIDLMSDLTYSLYIGPVSLEALKLCEAGARGIFLGSNFQGFNLLPYNADNLFLSARGKTFHNSILLPFIGNEIARQSNYNIEYSVYSVEHENVFGAYLKSQNTIDDTYPFYQSHVVLWNFLLNLFEINLEIPNCTSEQLNLLKSQQDILAKFIRLHDYAMASIDTIYHEARSQNADGGKIDGHLKNLVEIDRLSDQISQTNSLLRPVLDFYRIRRGQNHGDTLSDQTQTSFLAYSEEHQALQALNELISVTLKRNEVNI